MRSSLTIAEGPSGASVVLRSCLMLLPCLGIDVVGGGPVFLRFGTIVLFLLGDARSVRRVGPLFPTGWLKAEQGGLESRVPHAGGMAVGDLLGEDGIVGDLVPVDLERRGLVHRSPVATDAGTYILQAFLLEDREQEPRHGVVVGGHDGRLLVSCFLLLAGGDSRASREPATTATEQAGLYRG